MIKFYADKVNRNIIKITEVPKFWRSQVEAVVNEKK